jgi:hypothetical protein
MDDLLLVYWVLRLFNRGVGTSPKQLSDVTGCSLYRARKIFKTLVSYEWVYRKGNLYIFNSESTFAFAFFDAIRAWDKAA